MNGVRNENHHPGPESRMPDRLPKRKRVAFESWSLIVLAIIAGGLLFLALPNLIDDAGLWGYLKAFLLSISATLIAYGINRMAIDKGSELAATGFVTAGLVSVVSILLVGGGLFASTFSGLTLPDVERLRLQHHGDALTRFVGEQNRNARESGRVLPVLRAVSEELTQKAACEASESCLSGRGNGGHGAVARTLDAMSERAAIILKQMEAGEAARQRALAELNTLIGAYQKTLGDEETNIRQRRSELQKIDALMNQAVSDLNEAVPITLLRAYAQELQSPVMIADRPEATRQLGVLLAKHGQSLNAVLESLAHGNQSPPVLPPRAGVSASFEYIGHFLPIAAITGVVELVFPLCLWIYTFLALLWSKHPANSRAVQVAGSSPDNSSAHNGAQRGVGNADSTMPNEAGVPPFSSRVRQSPHGNGHGNGRGNGTGHGRAGGGANGQTSGFESGTEGEFGNKNGRRANRRES